MDGDRKEALGFLCRWCLLAMAWSGVPAAAYVGVVAASPRQEAYRAVVSDGVFAGREVGVAARLVPSPSQQRSAHLLLRLGGQLTCVEYRQGEPFYLRLRGAAAAGGRGTRVIGVPYVFLMFAGEGGRMRLLGPGRRVFLIDSSLATAAMGREPGTWARAMEEMRRRGDLAFFHPGPAEEFETFRNDLRRRGIQDPVVSAMAGASPAIASLERACDGLGGRQRKGDPGDVLTEQEAVASRAAALRFRAHWIVPDAAGPVRAPPGARIHRGLEEFIQLLAGEQHGPAPRRGD